MKITAICKVKSTDNPLELLDGKPIFLYALEQAMQCACIDEVYLESEVEAVHAAAKYTGCRHIYEEDGIVNQGADIYIRFRTTAPFLTAESFNRGVETLQQETQYDSVIFMDDHVKDYMEQKDLKQENLVSNSACLRELKDITSLYIAKQETLGTLPLLVTCSRIEAICANHGDGFALAEFVAKGMRQQENRYFRFLSKCVNSPMLSDILDDLKMDGVIQGFGCNLDGQTVFGRAKTLKIRAMKEGEDFNGIYDALKSYEQVTDNDIIIVENECPEYAYFGELNARLSIRSGASATIVGGVTRDRENVAGLGYPVFSKGYNCRDVRKRAVLDSMNQAITIQGIEIVPGDLIFADNDGIVVIKRQWEERVMDALKQKIESENNVVLEISRQTNPMKIVEEIGAF